MSTATLSIRIRKELKEKMMIHREVDWRREIERFIEERIKQLELEKILREIDEITKDFTSSPEPAWRSIREQREAR